MQLTLFIKILLGFLLFVIFVGGVVVVNELADRNHVIVSCLVGLSLLVGFTALGVFFSENRATVYSWNPKTETWGKSDWVRSFKDDDGARHRIKAGKYIYGGKLGSEGYDLCRYPHVYASDQDLVGRPVEDPPTPEPFRVEGGQLFKCHYLDYIFSDAPEEYIFESVVTPGTLTLWEVRERASAPASESLYGKMIVLPPAVE